MNAGQLLGAECLVAFGINSFQALKQGVVPYPGVLCRTAAAFGILSLVAIAEPEFAGMLGAGFLLALIVMQASNGWQSFGANIPTDGNYFYLTFGTNAGAGADNGA